MLADVLVRVEYVHRNKQNETKYIFLLFILSTEDTHHALRRGSLRSISTTKQPGAPLQILVDNQIKKSKQIKKNKQINKYKQLNKEK